MCILILVESLVYNFEDLNNENENGNTHNHPTNWLDLIHSIVLKIVCNYISGNYRKQINFFFVQIDVSERKHLHYKAKRTTVNERGDNFSASLLPFCFNS